MIAHFQILILEFAQRLDGGAGRLHFHSMKPAIDINDHRDMNADQATPYAGDRPDFRFAPLHGCCALIHGLCELLRHGVADITPTGKQRQAVDLMPDKSSQSPAIQSRRAAPAILVGSVQVFFEHLDVPEAGREGQGVLAARPGEVNQVEVAGVELNARPLHKAI